MASFTVKKGAQSKLQWPQIQNIVSINSTEDIYEKLKLNQLCSVTEKLDGCNLSLSSSGWVSSRRQVLIEDIEQTDLSKFKFNGHCLTNLKETWLRIAEAKAEVEEKLVLPGFELIIFGEFMTQGTATSIHDVFNYKPRGIKPEGFFAFGLAFNFDAELQGQEKEQFEKEARTKFDWNLFYQDENSKFFIFNYNCGLNKFFKERLFETVPYIGDDFFIDVLSNQSLAEKLKNRNIEGFVLTGPGFTLKWKFFEKGQKSSQKMAIEALKIRIDDKTLVDAIKTLENVALSEAPEGWGFESTPKSSRKLFSHLLSSAVSKLPSPADSLNSSTSVSDVKETCRLYRLTLDEEITKDLIERGFKKDSDLHREIQTKLESFVTGLFNKLMAKKRRMTLSTD